MNSKLSVKTPQSTPVWDSPLRLFHWALVLVVGVAGITGFLAPNWWLDIHVFVGYILGILLVFRLAWGFIGSRYSQFKSFPLTWEGVSYHLRAALNKNPPAHLGHNPVGAWMIIVLLMLLLTLVLSGLVVLGGKEGLGPLNFAFSYQTGKLIEEIHELAAWGLVGAVGIHLGGVLAETFLFRHPVLMAMITGEKEVATPSSQNLIRGFGLRGFLLFTIVTALLLMGGTVLAGLPSSKWRALETPTAYSNNCGDCHHAHHPSLRTKQAWMSIIKSLPDHYGEDASLDPKTVASLQSFLTENAATTFDTEVSNRMGMVDTPSYRITETKGWKRKHRRIDKAVFKLKSVGSKVNCNACHKDAETGRFDDHKIHLPIGDSK